MSKDTQSSGDSPKNMRVELENRILNVIDEVDKGFRRVMIMYSLAFYAGLGLVIFSVVGTLYFKDNVFPLVFGGVGVADVVAFFIFKPAEELQRSRRNLAQLVSAFLTWYNDTHNWNQVLAKELVKPDYDIEVFKEVSKRSMVNTITIMSAIELFVASKLSTDASEKLKTIMKDFEEKIEGV